DGNGAGLAQALDDERPFHVGQAEIEQQQIGHAALELAQGRGAAFRLGHLMAVRPQHGTEHAPDLRLVVDDEDAGAHAALPIEGGESSVAAPAGIAKVTRIVVPKPMPAERARMRPPCASTRPRLIDRPSPIPARLRSPTWTR